MLSTMYSTALNPFFRVAALSQRGWENFGDGVEVLDLRSDHHPGPGHALEMVAGARRLGQPREQDRDDGQVSHCRTPLADGPHGNPGQA